jgi:hypothetical protein
LKRILKQIQANNVEKYEFNPNESKTRNVKRKKTISGMNKIQKAFGSRSIEQ